MAVFKRIKRTKTIVRISVGRYLLYGPDYDTLSFLLKEKFAEQEYYFSASTSAPLIIDCGASIGMSVVYFKCLYPFSQIHCFEPYSAAFRLLEKNVAENKLKDVFCYNKALSLNDDTLSLSVPGLRPFVNARVTHSKTTGNMEQVQATSLAGFLSGFKKIDLLKMDVEGAEFEIVEDLFRQAVIKSGKINLFIIEYHHSIHQNEDRLTEFLKFFTDHDYSIRRKILYPDNQHSDLLIHAFKNNAQD